MNRRGRNLLIALATGAGLVAMLPSIAGAALTFKAISPLETGTNPSSVAHGDFNGDGDQDLAVANFGSDSISVIPGNGRGGFLPARTYPVGDSPRGIEAVDLDRDGAPEILTANANSSDVSLLRNSGQGTFGEAISLTVGGGPFSVTTGDFNGDGYPDLTVANSQASTVSVLVGTGNANFAAQEAFQVGAGPFAVRVGDLNNDGRPDIATADATADTVTVRLNTSGSTPPVSFGAPAAYPTGAGPFSITGSDFNGDGRPDLATANSEADTVSILLGLGAGAFSAPIPFAAGDSPYDLVAADFDGDRNSDIAAANYDSDDVTVLPGLGNGSFGNGIDLAAGNGPFGIASGLLNEDRVPDLAVANLDENRVSVLIDSPTASPSVDSLGFGTPVPVPRGTASSPKVLTFTNGGSAPLRIDGFTFGGEFSGDFMIDNDSCREEVAPGATCRIRIRFLPSGEGIRTATLTAQTNGPSNPSVVLAGQAGPYPRTQVTCRITGRTARKVKITCRVTYPVGAVSSGRVRWALARSGVVVRSGTASVSGSRASLDIGGIDALRAGRYLLSVGGDRAAAFSIGR